MLGTLNGALEARGIRLPPEAIRAEAEGSNEIADGVPVLTEIRVRYRLRIPPGSREMVDRALERHQAKCPTAVSLKESVRITWKADIEESG
ncbi:MAG TPA: OsmC family protein [Gemmatimonadota bacterium]|nr:OsmC family protein [Gemmatimonadota bacterium]